MCPYSRQIDCMQNIKCASPIGCDVVPSFSDFYSGWRSFFRRQSVEMNERGMCVGLTLEREETVINAWDSWETWMKIKEKRKKKKAAAARSREVHNLSLAHRYDTRNSHKMCVSRTLPSHWSLFLLFWLNHFWFRYEYGGKQFRIWPHSCLAFISSPLSRYYLDSSDCDSHWEHFGCSFDRLPTKCEH